MIVEMYISWYSPLWLSAFNYYGDRKSAVVNHGKFPHYDYHYMTLCIYHIDCL